MKRFYSTLAVLALLNTTNITAQAANDFKVFKPESKGERTAEKLLQSMVGDGVVLKSYSITKTSSDEAFGFFEDKKARLGMKKGLVMTTGGIAGLSSKNLQPNMSNNTHANAEGRAGYMNPETGYADLEKLLDHNKKTYDACVIELDLVPTADSLSFNYVFGSEEYDEYVGSEFNDVFAFLISGKGIDKERNLAVIPGTEIPVSVNSINNGNSTYRKSPSNPTFFVSNSDGNVGIEYDGLTRLMEIRQAVVPYETYHIKLAIADVSDNAFDSGVLLEGRSIVSYEKRYSVLFDKNSKEIDNSYKNLLSVLAGQYKDYNGKISITGYTDSEGSENYNQELSCNRANEISAYLKNHDVKPENIIVDCKGENMPLYDNNSEKGQHLNRRVELKILGNSETYAQKKAVRDIIKEEKSQLLQNYPNPFVGPTTIEAYVADNVKSAQVVIVNLGGQTVKTIHLLERGKTDAIFNADNLIEGLYTATLYADGVACGGIKLLMSK
jgi:outer membrane protein OmpA-like peptidoglycan-associated protein